MSLLIHDGEALRIWPTAFIMADTFISDSQFTDTPIHGESPPGNLEDRAWFAGYTAPKCERHVVRHLDAHNLESFLPTFETFHVWKNRQKKTIVQPLFPNYVFVRLTKEERRQAYQVPGLLWLVGGARGPIPIPSIEIEVLRSERLLGRLEPFNELVIGERVRIKDGPLQGMVGILIRKRSGWRFVLSVSMINQHAAIDVGAEDVEPIGDRFKRFRDCQCCGPVRK